jgi:hypothetical protein
MIATALVALIGVFASACMDSGGGARSSRSSANSKTQTGGSGSGGSGSAPTNGGIGSDLDDILANGRAELRHVVDPFDGTYKTKVTIPKNFTGLLYLSGLNVTSLSDRLVSVRFRFGREMEEIIIPATVGRAPGIFPQTDIEVLILDMTNQPFENLRLLYDLYDYNEYGTGETPTSDVRNGGLYCRGLKIEHDPTFEGSASNTECDSDGEICHYAYAKVVDSGLYDNATGVGINPSLPQIDSTKTGYANDSAANALMKCLPDNADLTNFQSVLNVSGVLALDYGVPNNLALNGKTYTYKGPYRTIARNDWQIKGMALFSDLSINGVVPSGLFQTLLPGGPASTVGDPNLLAAAGMNSFLFPRAGQMDLKANVQHFAAADPFASTQALTSLATAGKSQWMGGCNIRATNYDSFANEGISSCNVSATIDIITTDSTTGATTTLSTSNAVKIQITRASQTDYQGREVLYSAMKTCSGSSACGVSECCFNNRCWSKELVSQCLEDVPVVGNGGIGESCSSDYQCSSLCCNQSTGLCSVHMNTDQQQVLCSKSPGQQCVAKEWCRKENISQCFVVKTGLTNTGQTQCALRCYNVPTFGDCRDGICIPPTAPAVPVFDPSNPDCSEAIDPPTGF